MDNTNCPIMSSNVRGLNTPARRSVVCDTASTHRLDILCLQETKIEIWSPALAREIGGGRLDDCAVLPAIGTRGGIAIFWNSDTVSVQTHAIGQFSITARISLIGSQNSFWLTTVYGPADELRKDEFLAEIARAAPSPGRLG